MKIYWLALIVALLPNSLLAQDFTPPDRDLWEAMKRELAEIPASARAHGQISQIVRSVETEARAQALRAKVAAPPKTE